MNCQRIESTKFELIGSVFRKAAVRSRAVIDILPPDLDVDEEEAVIRAACGPVDALAELIQQMPGIEQSDPTLHRHATAWLDGKFWAMFDVENV